MEAFEYAIKKDIRNNPIVREVDAHREREQRHWVITGAVLVLLMLGSAWQHLELRNHGRSVLEMRKRLAALEQEGRDLGLRLERLRAPNRIEEYATRKLHMYEPNHEEAIILERVRPSDPPSPSVVARQ